MTLHYDVLFIIFVKDLYQGYGVKIDRVKFGPNK